MIINSQTNISLSILCPPLKRYVQTLKVAYSYLVKISFAFKTEMLLFSPFETEILSITWFLDGVLVVGY